MSEMKRIQKSRRLNHRRYAAAQNKSVNTSWATGSTSINKDIACDLESLRTRSRDMTQNDALMKQYIRLMRDNVIGHRGVGVHPQVVKANGTLDTAANDTISAAFKKWAKHASVDGKSLVKFEKEVIANTARDGECLVHFMRGRKYGEFGFKLKIIDPNHLDIRYDNVLTNGNVIISGVEVNGDGVEVAYWVWQRNPVDADMYRKPNKRVRILASDMLLVRDDEFPGQVRGVPWAHAALEDMKQLSDFNFAELVAARLSASKGTYLTKPEGSEEEDDDDDDFVADPIEPGAQIELPAGWQATEINPQHPNTNHANFVMATTMRIAAALGVSYSSLSQDVSKANYSSMRAAALIERETYKNKQEDFIEVFMEPVFVAWWNMATLNQQVSVPKLKGEVPTIDFKPKTWQWVDPTKDLQAVEIELNNSLTSRSAVASSRGRDYESILKEIAADKLLEERYGVVPTTKQMMAMTASTEEKDEGEDEDEGKKKKAE